MLGEPQFRVLAREHRVVGQHEVAGAAADREDILADTDFLPRFEGAVVEHREDRHRGPHRGLDLCLWKRPP